MAATANRTKKTAPEITSEASDAIDKLLAIEQYTKVRVIGRDDMLHDLVLAYVARTNVLFLGPPGTAKTMAVQRFASLVAPGKSTFDILLTKFTTREEVFGPLDMQEFKDGRIRFNTLGYAPSATYCIFDEVFKASGAICNASLRLLNEKTFLNGTAVEQCPTRSVVLMSNEYPEDPAMLAAFFDRAPIKRKVAYLDESGFKDMLRSKTSGRARKERAAELGCTEVPDGMTTEDAAAIDNAFKLCTVPDDVIEAVTELRGILRNKGVVVSDRRWGQAIDVMRASAVLDKRLKVSRRDMGVLLSVVWDNDSQLAIVDATLPDFLNPFQRDVRGVLDELYGERDVLVKAAGTPPETAKLMGAAGLAVSKVRAIGVRMNGLEDNAETEQDRELLLEAKAVIKQMEDVVFKISRGKASMDDLLKTAENDIQ